MEGSSWRSFREPLSKSNLSDLQRYPSNHYLSNNGKNIFVILSSLQTVKSIPIHFVVFLSKKRQNDSVSI